MPLIKALEKLIKPIQSAAGDSKLLTLQNDPYQFPHTR